MNSSDERSSTCILSHPSQKKIALGFLLAVLAAISTWYFVDHIIVAHQVSDAAAKGIPRGNLSDLYPRWLGARELLLRGRDPYSSEISREIQAGYYGRPLDPNRPTDPKDQQGFAYPLYVVFLLAPTVQVRFSLVQTGFRWLLIALLCASVPLWARAVGVKFRASSLLIWVVLLLGSFPAVQGIKLQQLTLLVCGFLAAAAAALASKHLIAAGVLLALATIKPQLSVIYLAWLALWVVSDWNSRKRLAGSFSATMILLFAASEWLLPGWIGRFYAAAGAYWNYTGGGNSWLDVALTPAVGKPMAALTVFILAHFCWRMRRYPADSSAWQWTMALVFVTTLVVIPTYALYNQVLLLPALILIADRADKSRSTRGTVVLAITAFSILWPWLTAMILDIVSLVTPGGTIQRTWAVPLWTTLAVPFTVLASIIVCIKESAFGLGRPNSAREISREV